MPDASKHDLPPAAGIQPARQRWFLRMLPLRGWLLGLLLALMCADYTFVATAGKFSTLKWRTHTYDLAVEGFRQGHLYLPIQPSPKLLALDDPFDFDNEPLWLWDASLYGGHYYFYWGPVPALCLWAFKFVTGYASVVDDQWLVLFFMIGRLFAGAALIWSIAARLGRSVPAWAVLLAIAMFGLASPTPYFLVRPLIYEASIAAGQCFLFWGLVAALWGLIRRDLQLPLFALASAAWGLALASRGSMILVAPLLVVITWWSALRYPPRMAAGQRGGAVRHALTVLLALGVPLGLCLGAHAWYNYARFDSVTEFGLNYQLTGRQVTYENGFILPNLFSYFGARLRWSCLFPFVDIALKRNLSPLISWPGDYDPGDYENGEHAAGILSATPFVWLIGFWLVRLARRALRERVVPRPDRDRFVNLERWFLLCACALCVTMFPALRMYMATMRYLQDFASAWLLIAMLAGFWLVGTTNHARSRPKVRAGSALFAVLALHTIAVGSLLGFRGQSNNFRRENSELFFDLQDQLSVCQYSERR